MKSETEKLRDLLDDYARAEKSGVGIGDHLRDEDFIRLIKNNPAAERIVSANNGGFLPAHNDDEFAALREHLAVCDVCATEFKNFYAFFAAAETGEPIAEKSEIVAAWEKFAPRVTRQKQSKLRAWLFNAEKKINFSAALGWSFAALLLVLSGIGFYQARQSQIENSQLAAQLEKQKQISEERQKTLERSGGENSEPAKSDDGENLRLEAEKAVLQKQIARLETEIERAKRQPQTAGDLTPPPPNAQTVTPTEEIDDSLIAVNTPIYDVYPADSAMRGDAQAENKFIVPSRAKSIVLILNAAGRADLPAYRAELAGSDGKIIWRGANLRKDASGNFTLTLSRRALKAGTYRLKLFGKNAGESAQAIAEYPLSIEIK